MQKNRLNLVIDPWRIVEERFDPLQQQAAESLFALGNGVMGAVARLWSMGWPRASSNCVRPSSASSSCRPCASS